MLQQQVAIQTALTGGRSPGDFRGTSSWSQAQSLVPLAWGRGRRVSKAGGLLWAWWPWVRALPP